MHRVSKGSWSDKRSLSFAKPFPTYEMGDPTPAEAADARRSPWQHSLPVCSALPHFQFQVLRHRWATGARFREGQCWGCDSGWREAARDGGRGSRVVGPDLGGVLVRVQGSAQPWRAAGGPRWASSSSWAPALSSPLSCTPCTGRRPRSPESSRSVLTPA